ncbi:MAG: histidine kinase [Bacteroidia bacterium]|nr:histidine kinase [Bacteroidia bacterium]
MKETFNIFCTIFFLQLGCYSVFAQHPAEEGYVSPITEVFGHKIGGYYDIKEDWNGFIWMATNNGLLRIDGSRARVFSRSKTDSTLTHKIVYHILVDEENKLLWLATAMGLTRFDPATEKSKHYQAVYENPNSLADNIVRHVYKDSEGDIWAGCFNHGLSRYRAESDDFENFYFEVPEIDSLQNLYPNVNESRINSFKEIKEDTRDPDLLWLSTPQGIVSFRKSSKEFQWQFLKSEDPQANYLMKSSTDFLQIGGKILIGTHSEGFMFDIEKKTVHPLDLGPDNTLNYIVEINEHPDGFLQLTYVQGLVYFDPHKEQLINKWEDIPRQGKYYGIRLIDSQGRIWLNSSRVSAIFDPIKQISEDYNLPAGVQGNPQVFKKIGNGRIAMLFGKNRTCYIFDTNKRSWQRIRMSGSGLDLENVIWNDLISYRNHELLLLSEEKVFRLNLQNGNLKELKVDLDHSYPGFTKALLDKKGRLWLATRRVGLLRQDRPGTKMHHYVNELNSEFSSSLYTWITDLLEDRAGNVWIRLARSYAIYETQKDRFRVFSHYKTPEKTFRYIRNFSEDPTGDVWVASEDTGLGRTDAMQVEKGIVQKLSVRDGLFSDEIKQISFDQEANLWMLTENGLSRFHSKNPNVWNYPWDRGIPKSDFILTLEDGSLALARSDGGISLINPINIIEQKNIPYPYITSVIAADQVQYEAGNRIDLKEIEIEEGRDYLSIAFSAIGYSNPKEFAYKLKGVDTDWVLTREFRSTSYSNLSPKSYTFYLKSRLVGGEWSEEVSVNIYLVPKWFETLWFKIIAALLILMIAYSVYRWRLEDVRNQERIKADFQQRINDVEMQSLRSQMNPHFLFNSLNSIQLYIIKNKPEKAVEYLGNFSRLMRLILSNSRSKTITLKQELESLQLYMELENLRFSDMFEFHIYVEKEVRINDFELPPMLLQPFVENAIWHGLQPKEGKGEINIHISLEEEYLVCEIQDNGIGREASARLKGRPKKQHKSMGMKITADRLEMINHAQYGQASMEIEDLYHANGEAAGTKVIVRVPI